MSKNTLPSVSTSGWITSVAEKADRCLAYFFVSDYSQSDLYPNKITSLPYILQHTAGDTQALRDEVQTSLNQYLGRYFDQVNTVATADTTDTTDQRLNLKILVAVTQDGVQYNLSKLVATLNSAIVEIININNN